MEINEQKEKKMGNNCTTGNCVYGLGFIGALIFYIQHATTFWIGLLGFFKALVWPAMLVYALLGYLGLQ